MLVCIVIGRHRLSSESAPDSAGNFAGSELENVASRISEVVQVGELRPGETRNVEFRVLNNTEMEWRVDRTRTSCGCLSVEILETVVAPGASLCGSAVVRAKSASHREPYGSMATVELEGAPGEIRISFQGHVEPELLPDPERLAFSVSNPDEDIRVERITIQAKNASGKELRVHSDVPNWVTEVEIAPAAIAVTHVGDRTGQQFSWDVALYWDPLRVERNRRGKIRFYLAGSDSVFVDIPYSASVATLGAAVYPSQLFFGKIPVGASATKPVLITIQDDWEPGLLPDIALSPGLVQFADIEVERIQEGRFKLTASLLPGVTGDLDELITIRRPANGGTLALVPVIARIVETPSE